MTNHFKQYISIILMKILLFKQNIRNKTIFGRVIATIFSIFNLCWKNEKETLNLMSIIFKKSENYKVDYESL